MWAENVPRLKSHRAGNGKRVFVFVTWDSIVHNTDSKTKNRTLFGLQVKIFFEITEQSWGTLLQTLQEVMDIAKIGLQSKTQEVLSSKVDFEFNGKVLSISDSVGGLLTCFSLSDFVYLLA